MLKKKLIALLKAPFQQVVVEEMNSEIHKPCPDCGGSGLDVGWGNCMECRGKGFVNKTYKERFYE